MKNQQHIAIICNPKSGKGLAIKQLPYLQRYLQNQRITFEIFKDKLPEKLNNFTDLIIMGGDGTLNYVLNFYQHIPIPIGIIPCGTGNDFANLLLGKCPIDIYCEKAVHSMAQPVDAGKCNHQLFLNGAGIGFDGWVVKKSLAKKILSGKAAYYSTVISLLLFYKETNVQISIDGEQFNTHLFMLTVANGKSYGGGFKVAPKASITDGLLETTVISQISIADRFQYLPVIEKGMHLQKKLPFINYTRCSHISIQSEEELEAHLDGEYLRSKEFNIQVLPAYLTIRY